jgi:hypothetical protein
LIPQIAIGVIDNVVLEGVAVGIIDLGDIKIQRRYYEWSCLDNPKYHVQVEYFFR